MSETRDKLRWLDKNCHVCGCQLNSWDERISKALQYRNTVCEKCVAKEYGYTVEQVRETMEEWFDIRPCMGL